MSTFNDYNKYDQIDMLAYSAVSKLLTDNENIWKMLYYPDPKVLIDPISFPDLTSAQKRALIYRGQQEDTSDFRVFFTGGNNNDAFVERVTLLRIYPLTTIPDNNIIGTTSVVFECISHYKVDTIYNTESSYSARSLTIIKEILKTLNGQSIDGGLGAMFFNKRQGFSNKIQYEVFTDKGFSGYSLIMSVKAGASDDTV